jgi:putative SOS response-associated peptidase YedK
VGGKRAFRAGADPTAAGERFPAMCNDYERHIKEQDYARALAAAQLEHLGELAVPPPADDVRVGEMSVTLIASGNGVALTCMRWAFAPERKGRAPVFNFRGDGRRFDAGLRIDHLLVSPVSQSYRLRAKRYHE